MNSKIVQYGVCAGNTDGELAGYVNEKLKEGYQPYGFVFTSIQHEQLFFHQVMIKTGVVRKPAKKKVYGKK